MRELGWSRRVFLAAGLAAPAACYMKSTPIRTVGYGPGARRRLVVMLPGLGDRAEAFEHHHMIQPLLDSGFEADAIAVNAHFGYYRDGSVTTRVKEDVLEPARARGYEEIWMLGISMGGFGSLMTASRHPELVNGLFIMAPYLGQSEATDAVRAAGGLAEWQRTPEQTGYTFDLWAWLTGYARGQARPPLFLGYGDQDDGGGTKSMLATPLPPERVFVRPGAHEWSVWQPMWSEMLGAAKRALG